MEDIFLLQNLKPFLSVLKRSIIYGVNIKIFFDCIFFKNIQSLQKNTDINFYYFIPSFSENKNILIVGFTKGEYVNEFRYEKEIWEYDNIVEFLSNDLYSNFNKNVITHEFFWTDQKIVSSYLDYLCSGLVSLLPENWVFLKNEVTYEKFEKNYLLYYNLDLDKNKNLKLKEMFYKNR